MGKFNINGFKENPERKITTLDGNDVEIIYTGLRSGSPYRNVAVECCENFDRMIYFSDDGEVSDGRRLIFKPEEIALYVNVYKCECNDSGYIITAPYKDREKAVDAARSLANYLATGTLTFTID